MHYPKVLERVDSPEQILHRSFSLGAPELSLGQCFCFQSWRCLCLLLLLALLLTKDAAIE